MPKSLNCSLFLIFVTSYDCCSFISYFLPHRRSSHSLALNFILLVSTKMYSLCKPFCIILMSSLFFIPSLIWVLSAKQDTASSQSQEHVAQRDTDRRSETWYCEQPKTGTRGSGRYKSTIWNLIPRAAKARNTWLREIPIDDFNPSYLGLGYITPTKLLMTNFTSLVSLTLVSV